MTPRAERGVQRPEHLDDAQGPLGHGLGEIAAARRHRADDGHGALETVEGLRAPCTLVELAEPGAEVGGEALLPGHLLEAARELAHRLGPSGGRVGHEGDVVAHVPVVLRERHARVDGRLPCCDRHVARVRDQGHPLHEGRAGVRVLELRERRQDLRHLVAALAAANVDDDLRVTPL